jgi:hypothetical protein
MLMLMLHTYVTFVILLIKHLFIYLFIYLFIHLFIYLSKAKLQSGINFNPPPPNPQKE